MPLYILQINPLGHIDCVPIKPLKTLPEAIYSSISISSSNTCPENEDSSAARARATARALARRLARALAWRMKILSLSLIENWKRPTAGTENAKEIAVLEMMEACVEAGNNVGKDICIDAVIIGGKIIGVEAVIMETGVKAKMKALQREGDSEVGTFW